MADRAGSGASALLAATTALLAAVGSCGAVVGQIPFSQEGTGEVTFQAQAGEVRFWTDFSAQYHGDMVASFEVQHRGARATLPDGVQRHRAAQRTDGGAGAALDSGPAGRPPAQAGDPRRAPVTA
jgi:hypothetical protein